MAGTYVEFDSNIRQILGDVEHLQDLINQLGKTNDPQILKGLHDQITNSLKDFGSLQKGIAEISNALNNAFNGVDSSKMDASINELVNKFNTLKTAFSSIAGEKVDVNFGAFEDKVISIYSDLKDVDTLLSKLGRTVKINISSDSSDLQKQLNMIRGILESNGMITLSADTSQVDQAVNRISNEDVQVAIDLAFDKNDLEAINTEINNALSAFTQKGQEIIEMRNQLAEMQANRGDGADLDDEEIALVDEAIQDLVNRIEIAQNDMEALGDTINNSAESAASSVRREMDEVTAQMEQLAKVRAELANRTNLSSDDNTRASYAQQLFEVSAEYQKLTQRMTELTQVESQLGQAQGQVQGSMEAVSNGSQNASVNVEKLATAMQKVEVDTEKIVPSLRKAKQEINDADLAFKKGAEQMHEFDMAAGNLQGKLAMGLGFAGVAASLGGFISQMTAVRSQFQAADIAIETMLGNKEKADELMAKVRKYASISPLTFGDITGATQMMLGFNIEAEKVPRFIEALGDVSMGSSQKFNSLALAFSQMSATGKLMGQDLNQMINAGFNPLQAMAAKTGKTIVQLKKDMSDGKITSQDVQEAFIAATSEGGRFYKMSENASKTIVGQQSMLEDATDAMFNKIGIASEKYIISGIQMTTNLVTQWETVGKAILNVAAVYGVVKGSMLFQQALRKAAINEEMRITEEKKKQLDAEKESLANAQKEQAMRQLRKGKYETEEQIVNGEKVQRTVFRGGTDQQVEELSNMNFTISEEQKQQLSEEVGAMVDNLETEPIVLNMDTSGVDEAAEQYNNLVDSLAASNEGFDQLRNSINETLAPYEEMVATAQDNVAIALEECDAAAKSGDAIRQEAAARQLATAEEELNTAVTEYNTTATQINNATREKGVVVNQLDAKGKVTDTAATVGNTGAQIANNTSTATGIGLKKLFTLATRTATGAVRQLGAALMNNPYTVAIAAIAALCTWLYSLYEAEKEAEEEEAKLRNEIITSAKEIQKSLDIIDNSNSSYTQRTKAIDDTINAMKEHGMINDKLMKQLDTEAEKIMFINQNRERLIELIQQEAAVKAEAEARQAAEEEMRTSMKDAMDSYTNDKWGVGEHDMFEEEMTRLREELEEQGKSKREIESIIAQYSEDLDESTINIIEDQMAETLVRYGKHVAEIKERFKNDKEGMEKALKEADESLLKSQNAVLDRYKLADFQKNRFIDNALKAVNKERKAGGIRNLTTTNEAYQVVEDKTVKKGTKAINTFMEAVEKAKAVTQAFGESTESDVKNKMQDVHKEVERLTKAYNDQQKVIEDNQEKLKSSDKGEREAAEKAIADAKAKIEQIQEQLKNEGTKIEVPLVWEEYVDENHDSFAKMVESKRAEYEKFAEYIRKHPLEFGGEDKAQALAAEITNLTTCCDEYVNNGKPWNAEFTAQCGKAMTDIAELEGKANQVAGNYDLGINISVMGANLLDWAQSKINALLRGASVADLGKIDKNVNDRMKREKPRFGETPDQFRTRLRTEEANKLNKDVQQATEVKIPTHSTAPKAEVTSTDDKKKKGGKKSGKTGKSSGKSGSSTDKELEELRSARARYEEEYKLTESLIDKRIELLTEGYEKELQLATQNHKKAKREMEEYVQDMIQAEAERRWKTAHGGKSEGFEKAWLKWQKENQNRMFDEAGYTDFKVGNQKVGVSSIPQLRQEIKARMDIADLELEKKKEELEYREDTERYIRDAENERHNRVMQHLTEERDTRIQNYLTSNNDLQKMLSEGKGKGNIKSILRPMVEAQQMLRAGWSNISGSDLFHSQARTVEYNQHKKTIKDKRGKTTTKDVYDTVELLMTPILPDGSILSPTEFEKYISEILSKAKTQKELIEIDADATKGGKGLVMRSATSQSEIRQEEELLHNLLEEMYNNVDFDLKAEMKKHDMNIRLASKLTTYFKSQTDFYRNYGTYEQKIENINKSFDQQRAAIDPHDLYAKAANDMERQDAIEAVRFEQIKEAMDWEEAFNDLSIISEGRLKELQGQLAEYMSMKDISVENRKIVADMLDNIRTQLSERKNIWMNYVGIPTEIQDLFIKKQMRQNKAIRARQESNAANNVYNTRQEEARKAQEDYYMAQGDVETIKGQKGVKDQIIKMKQQDLNQDNLDDISKQLIQADIDNLQKESAELQKAVDAAEQALSGFAEKVIVATANEEKALKEKEKAEKKANDAEFQAKSKKEQRTYWQTEAKKLFDIPAKTKAYKEADDEYQKAKDAEKEAKKNKDSNLLDYIQARKDAKEKRDAKKAEMDKSKAEGKEYVNEQMSVGKGDALAAADALVQIINANIQSLPELTKKIGISDEAQDRVEQFAEGMGYATAALDSLKNGDFIGAISNLDSAFMSLGDSLFGTNNVNSLQREIENLKLSNTNLEYSINALAEDISNVDLSAMESYSAYLKSQNNLEEMFRTYQQLAKDEASKKNMGRHSVNHAVRENLDASLIASVNRTLAGSGSTFRIDPNDPMASLLGADSETLALLRKERPDFFTALEKAGNKGSAEGADEVIANLTNAAEIAKRQEENQKSILEKMAGMSWEQLRDWMKQGVGDLKKGMYQVGLDIDQQINDLALQSIFEDEQLQNMIKNAQKGLAESREANNGKVTKYAADQYKKGLSEAFSYAKELQNQYKDAGVIKDNSALIEASGRGYSSLSEDTGQQLNGRFTAMHMTEEQINTNVGTLASLLPVTLAQMNSSLMMLQGGSSYEGESLAHIASDVRQLMVDSMLTLTTISTNTENTVKELKVVSTRLGEIKDNLD